MELDDVLSRAHARGEEGDWEGMAELLYEHAEDFDDEPAFHCWLGVAERELGLDGMAYERFRHSLALNPEDPYVLAMAGNGVAAFDDPDAEQALRTAALLGPEVSLTHLLYGAYLAREGLFDEAVRELTRARELDPDEPQGAYELGVAHALAGRMEMAADALGDAVSLEPDSAWNRVVFGLVLLEGQRWEEALGELMEGAVLEPDDVEAQLAAGLAAAASGREESGLEMLERARFRALDEDQEVIMTVEERIDAGADSARALLVEEMAPDMLRRRLAERP